MTSCMCMDETVQSAIMTDKVGMRVPKFIKKMSMIQVENGKQSASAHDQRLVQKDGSCRIKHVQPAYGISKFSQ